MLRSNYYDLTDMPSRPVCEPGGLPMYVISFNIRVFPKNHEIFVADFLRLPVDVFGGCKATPITYLGPLFLMISIISSVVEIHKKAVCAKCNAVENFEVDVHV